MKQSVIITRGLPASGKTTYAETLVASNQRWKRINKDDIRKMIHSGIWSKETEKDVLKVRDNLLSMFLRDRHSVVIDDTNIRSFHVHRIQHLIDCEFPNVSIEVIDFNVDMEECIRRDALRENPVGENVIRMMHSDYSKINKDDWKKFVRMKEDKCIDTRGLPHCILVDIDGTIAEMKDRTPHELHKVYQDEPNTKVLRAVSDMKDQGRCVILVSGRSESCRELTTTWLMDKAPEIHGSLLLMRKEGDNRKDYIVKRELFDECIRGIFNIDAVFDDRDQVVNMWRNHLGLTVFQVNKGDF